MSDVAGLLPRDPTGALERALAAGMSSDLAVPFDELLDPYRTEEEFLPWLAAHHSVDLWFDDWSMARKREMIAQCAGVSLAYPASPLGAVKGTLVGLERYLAFVDAEVVDRIAYPARFVVGRSALGIAPIAHPPFKARYLIKVALARPLNAFVIGRTPLGRWSVPPLGFGDGGFALDGVAEGGAIRVIDRTPIERAKLAARIAKFEETQYVVSFSHRRKIRFGDRVTFGENRRFGAFADRQSIARG